MDLIVGTRGGPNRDEIRRFAPDWGREEGQRTTTGFSSTVALQEDPGSVGARMLKQLIVIGES